MEKTAIRDLKEHVGEVVRLQGWLQTLRDQKSMQFLILRDRTGLVQIAHWKKGNPELAEQISTLGTESALTVTGKVVENEVVKLGGIEIQLENLIVENNAEIPLPFDPFAETLPDQDYRLDWRFLDLRRERNRLIFEIQTTLEAAMREYWLENGFIEMHSPKIMGAPSESGAELFSLKYFETTAYLAQSPQFYKQMAMAAGYEKVFEIGPVFRADPSFTSRHMTEFTGVDFEISWIESHEDVMSVAERWLAHAYRRVQQKHGEAIKAVFDVDLQVPEVPFPRLTMAEAYQILKDQGYKLPLNAKATWTRARSARSARISRNTPATISFSSKIGLSPSGLSIIWYTRTTPRLPKALTCSDAGWKSPPAPSANTATRFLKTRLWRKD